MLGFTPYRFYYYMWKFVTPVLLLVLLVASIIQLGLSPPSYSAWNQQMVRVKLEAIGYVYSYLRT